MGVQETGSPISECSYSIKVVMLLSAGIIIARQVEGQRLYLFLCADNYLDFSKLKVETGKTPFKTALREVREEAGLGNLSFRWRRIFKESAILSDRDNGIHCEIFSESRHRRPGTS